MASLRLGRHCATARLAESPSRTAISPVPWTIETHLSRAIELLDSYSTVFSYRKVSGLSQHGSCVSHICKHIRTRRVLTIVADHPRSDPKRMRLRHSICDSATSQELSRPS